MSAALGGAGEVCAAQIHKMAPAITGTSGTPHIAPPPPLKNHDANLVHRSQMCQLKVHDVFLNGLVSLMKMHNLQILFKRLSFC